MRTSMWIISSFLAALVIGLAVIGTRQGDATFPGANGKSLVKKGGTGDGLSPVFVLRA